uniref:Uncharacterized protein n=1 Tax=Globodera rostochiensis TaxID=31243 RepID=A0A914HN58_GLORO
MPAPTNFGQNVHHQIDRQNIQIGQIEPNSTDQNHPLTESDHSDNAKNGEEISSNKKRGEGNLAIPSQAINTPTANKMN